MSSKTFKLSTIAGCILVATQANAALYRVVEVETTTLTSAQEYYSAGISESSSVDAENTAITGSATKSCFSTACVDTNFSLAGDTLNGAVGFSFKNEVPLNYDNYFYLQDDTELNSYCDSQLRYSTCDAWSSERWNGSTVNGTVYGGLKSEREAFSQTNYKSNSTAFNGSSTLAFDINDVANVPSGVSAVADTAEMVVNELDRIGTTDYVIGNASSGYFNSGSNYVQLYRQRGFVNNGTDTLVLLPQYEDTTSSYAATVTASDTNRQNIVTKMGRSMAYDTFSYGGNTYIVGSAAVAPFDYTDSDKDYESRDVTTCITESEPALLAACQNFAFAQKAYVWQVSEDATTKALSNPSSYAVANWDTTDSEYANYGDGSAQASARAATIVNRSGSSYDTLPVLVGYNTTLNTSLSNGRDMMMQATVFRPATTTSFAVDKHDAWTSTTIASATVGDGNTAIYDNSIAKDINQNLIVVGEAKRLGSRPENGAAANRLFVADANADVPTASYFSGGIFFTGAGGEVNAINNYNEIVGSIDAETHREVGGKSRKRRAFINPFDASVYDDDLATSDITSRRAIFNNQAWWLDDLTNGGTYSTDNNKYRIFTASDINDAGVISATAFKCEAGYDSTSHFSYCGGGSEAEKVVAVKLIPLSSDTSIEPRTEDIVPVSREGAGLGWLSLGLLGLLGFRRRK